MDFKSGFWLLAGSWCTKPSFDDIHTSLDNFSPALLQPSELLTADWEGGAVGSEWREMKRSRWWERSERHQTGPVHPPPTTCLLSWSQPWLRPTTRLVSNHSWWIPPGDRSGDWDQGRTHPLGQAYLVIDVCHSVKIFVIIESSDNLTNSKYWASTIIIYRIVY